MGTRAVPFVEGEWYHCYSRGIDKRTTFDDHSDYIRFLQALYLCNDSIEHDRQTLIGSTSSAVFQIEREETLVSIGAYCLMPNHFHLLLYEKTEGGISHFMQKLGTAYTKYYNERNERVGGLFTRPFRAKHINSDDYLREIIPYIHLNPRELIDNAPIAPFANLEKALESYYYSSFPDFRHHKERSERAIIDWSAIASVYDMSLPLGDASKGAQQYLESLKW